MFLNVLSLGAVADGVTDNTACLQGLLDSLEPEGGTLFFPAGRYLTGSLVLHSHTTVHLEAGAVLCASTDHDLYPVVGEDMIPGYVRGTRRAILFSYGCENLTVCGEGTIEGNGSAWWNSGESDEMRPRTIQFIGCRNIRIRDIRIQNSPCWTVHPIRSENITVDGITICNPENSANTDGINPESCKNVRISNCCIDVGDDCITIKSGLERDLYQKAAPCENIVVTNCTFVHGHGGVVIGSEMSGGVRNITITNCICQETNIGIRIKTRRRRGGIVEDILVSNVIFDNVISGITANEYYCCGANRNDTELFTNEPRPVDAGTPAIRNVQISGVMMKNVRGCGIFFYGIPESPVENVRINAVDIRAVGDTHGYYAVSCVKLDGSNGDGIYLKNVSRIRINDCTLNAKRHPLILDGGLHDVTLNGERLDKEA